MFRCVKYLIHTHALGFSSLLARFQKVYDYVDLNIGYRFVNVLFRNPRDGSLEVDVSLLNDVIEQNGGGAEPLHCGDALNQSRVFVM